MRKPTLVILVDDHEDMVAMYALMLGTAGFHVLTAATAEEAVDLAQDGAGQGDHRNTGKAYQHRRIVLRPRGGRARAPMWQYAAVLTS